MNRQDKSASPYLTPKIEDDDFYSFNSQGFNLPSASFPIQYVHRDHVAHTGAERQNECDYFKFIKAVV